MKRLTIFSFLVVIGMLVGSFSLMADNGNSGGNNSSNNGNNNGGNGPQNMEQKERFEFLILNQAPRERPRDVGYVDMNLCGRCIVADCLGIGNATFDIYSSNLELVQRIEMNTVETPRVILNFPEEAGEYTFVVSSSNYYGEWDFTVQDNCGYIYQAFEL